MTISWKKIDNIEQLLKIEKQWDKLNIKANNGCFFTSPTWLLNWYNIFWKNEWHLHCFALLDQDKLIALLPFYFQEQTSIIKTQHLFLLGQGEQENTEVASEYLDILIDINYTDEVISQCKQHLMLSKFDSFYTRAIERSAHILKIFPKHTQQLCGIKYYVAPQQWHESSLSKNTKNRLKRSKNQLKKLDGEFFWINEYDKPNYWQTMSEFHQNRWQNKNYEGAFDQKQFHNFHSCLIKNHKNTLMCALRINERVVAINYYLLDANNLYFYQSGWDEDNFKQLSPGFSLHIWAIKNCNFSNYDFMMGDIKDSYKSKFNSNQDKLFKISIKFSPLKYLMIKILRKIFTN